MCTDYAVQNGLLGQFYEPSMYVTALTFVWDDAHFYLYGKESVDSL